MKNIQVIIGVLMHDINVKQSELFSLHQKIDNLMQIYEDISADFSLELESDLHFQNEEYMKFLIKRRKAITEDIEELKAREHYLTENIKETFKEREKLKIFLKKNT